MIKTPEEYETAMRRLDKLMGDFLDEEEFDELEALALLVDRYEDAQCTFGPLDQ